MTAGIAASVAAEVARRLDGRLLARFCDFDGTLTGIIDDPDAVVLPAATRQPGSRSWPAAVRSRPA